MGGGRAGCSSSPGRRPRWPAANTAAFNVGNTLGPVAGGLAIAAGYGYAAPSWIALVLVIGSILLGVAGWWKDSHP